MAVKKCNSIQQSVSWCPGAPQLAGIRKRVYYIAKNEIVKFAQLERDENGRATSAKLKGDFELAADAKFKYIDILANKSGHTSDPQGEMPSQTQLNKLVLVHPGTEEEASALSAYLNNSDNLFIFQDKKGNYRVVGNDKYDTNTTVSQDSGQSPTDQVSTTINVEVPDEVISPFYTGKLETEDGEIDCSTGELAA